VGQTAGTNAVAMPADRLNWLVQGEAKLAAGQAEAALDAFEHAAQMQHAADAEIGIVRSHMQAGEYRRALTFASHAAGAHRDHPEAAALYAWLLYRGGETAAAGRYITQGLQAAPEDADLQWLRSMVASGASPGSPSQAATLTSSVGDEAKTADQRPSWLSPLSTGAAVAATARVTGSGLLLSNGDRAWVPMTTLEGARRIWLRNGLGQTAAADVLQQESGLGLALLALRTPLGSHAVLPAAREPFPGSPGALVEFEPDGAPRAAWPLLRQGFLGRSLPAGSARALGIAAPPGPRGGPVFDRGGRLAGMALAVSGEPDRLVPWADLARAADRALLAPPAVPGPVTPAAPLAVDAVYEAALRVAVQVLVAD
jgi:hypothetical protein